MKKLKPDVFISTHCGTVEIQPSAEQENRVLLSSNPIEISKEFGPTIFASLRITPDYERGWVIERKANNFEDWVEWCTIPAQIDEIDFMCKGCRKDMQECECTN